MFEFIRVFTESQNETCVIGNVEVGSDSMIENFCFYIHQLIFPLDLADKIKAVIKYAHKFFVKSDDNIIWHGVTS